MTKKVLFVDDDLNILSAFKRQLYDLFDMTFASDGAKALRAFDEQGPFQVVVSDLQMPGMDGLEFLGEIRKRSELSVLIMLTGNADVYVAIKALNEGFVYRFLTKPCPAEDLARSIEDGLEMYRLKTAERELLEKTLHGSVRMLTDLLALANPTAFGRASRIRRWVDKMVNDMNVPDAWQVKIAAMLSQAGCIGMPDQIMDKLYNNKQLNAGEADLFFENSEKARKIIENVPRLEEVSRILAYQDKRFDGGGYPTDDLSGVSIPLGSRILKVANDFDSLLISGQDERDALKQMYVRGKEWYDPVLLNALKNAIDVELSFEAVQVRLDELRPEMIVYQDIIGPSGIMLIPKGQEVTSSLIMRLKTYAFSTGFSDPIKVLIPGAFGADEE
jgi:response regulator RpfG family c-di-GMP phosphodiesterase